MGGIVTPEQAELSHQRDREAGMSANDIITLRAAEVAQARHEHELMMSLVEITWEIRDGRLYSAQYQRYFSDIVNPPEDRRAEGYVPLRPHVLENLFAAERLITSGTVKILCIISPSIDFQGEGSTKGQCYRWRLEDGKVKALCSDHSQDIKQMLNEIKAIYGPDFRRSLGGNTTNSGGVFASSREDTPTRSEMAAIIRELGNEKLARQYEHASIYGKDLSPGEYLVELTRIELERMKAEFQKAGIDPEKNPGAALRMAERLANEALQAIKALSTSIRKEGNGESSGMLYSRTGDAVLSSYSSHGAAESHAVGSWSHREDKQISLPRSGSSVEFGASYHSSGVFQSVAKAVDTTEGTRISRDTTTDSVRYNSDHYYRFVKDHEEELARKAAQGMAAQLWASASADSTRSSLNQSQSSAFYTSSPQPTSSWTEPKVDTKWGGSTQYQASSFGDSTKSNSPEYNNFSRPSRGASIFSSTRSVRVNSQSINVRNVGALGERSPMRGPAMQRDNQQSGIRAKSGPLAAPTSMYSNGVRIPKGPNLSSISTRTRYRGPSVKSVGLSQGRKLHLKSSRIVSKADSKPGLRRSLLYRVRTRLQSYLSKAVTMRNRIRQAARRVVQTISRRIQQRIVNRYVAIRARVASYSLKVVNTLKLFVRRSVLPLVRPLFRAVMRQMTAPRKWLLSALKKFLPAAPSPKAGRRLVSAQMTTPPQVSKRRLFIAATLEGVTSIFRRKKSNQGDIPLLESPKPLSKRLKMYWRARRLRRKLAARSKRPKDIEEWDDLFPEYDTLTEEAGNHSVLSDFVIHANTSEENDSEEIATLGGSTEAQDVVSGPQQNDSSPVWRLDTHLQRI